MNLYTDIGEDRPFLNVRPAPTFAPILYFSNRLKKRAAFSCYFIDVGTRIV